MYEFRLPLQLEEESLKIRKTLYNDNPAVWAEDYTTSLNNLASSLSKIKKFPQASKYFKEYFHITNFDLKDDITWFIYPFVKWYQCEYNLKNHKELLKLELLAKDLIKLYRNKLATSYNDIIKENELGYKEFSESSDNLFDKEKYEIFIKIFAREEI